MREQNFTKDEFTIIAKAFDFVDDHIHFDLCKEDNAKEKILKKCMAYIRDRNDDDPEIQNIDIVEFISKIVHLSESDTEYIVDKLEIIFSIDVKNQILSCLWEKVFTGYYDSLIKVEIDLEQEKEIAS